MNSIQDFPSEISFHLFEYLSGGDLLKCAKVSKVFNQLASENHLWKEFSKEHHVYLLSKNYKQTILTYTRIFLHAFPYLKITKKEKIFLFFSKLISKNYQRRFDFQWRIIQSFITTNQKKIYLHLENLLQEKNIPYPIIAVKAMIDTKTQIIQKVFITFLEKSLPELVLYSLARGYKPTSQDLQIAITKNSNEILNLPVKTTSLQVLIDWGYQFTQRDVECSLKSNSVNTINKVLSTIPSAFTSPKYFELAIKCSCKTDIFLWFFYKGYQLRQSDIHQAIDLYDSIFGIPHTNNHSLLDAIIISGKHKFTTWDLHYVSSFGTKETMDRILPFAPKNRFEYLKELQGYVNA